jgi:hypothetical protein
MAIHQFEIDETDLHDHASRAIEPGPRSYPPPMWKYDGLPIKRICHNAIVSAADQNHCAHFVCHVMRWNQIPGAAKCSYLSRHDTPGVHIRVNEIFNYVQNRAFWGGGALPDTCLIYATISANIQGNPPTMGQNHRKHIGIHYQGKIWHYSTDNERVFGDTPTHFRQRMTHAYGQTTVYYRSDFVR